ncbi:MAG: circadian clock protein KaiC, partial [Alphaproteobacteria bacterium]|nr:circadian clock protein KaiC [Alphaproteobacteria bacterium]
TGPAGVGKTTTAVRCLVASLERGEHVAYYLFDERLATLLQRSAALGMDLQPYLDNGQLTLRQIDPAELSPGEFAGAVQAAVETDGARMIVIDSINAYMHGMPSDNFLVLQMHELLSYLSQQGIISLMILGQHGVMGDLRVDIDVSYLADAVVLMRFFEVEGTVRKSIAVIKTRTSDHERIIREFDIGASGITIGEPLTGFAGLLSGHPNYVPGNDRLLKDA